MTYLFNNSKIRSKINIVVFKDCKLYTVNCKLPSGARGNVRIC